MESEESFTTLKTTSGSSSHCSDLSNYAQRALEYIKKSTKALETL
jgi:hypothetical protein